MNTAYNIPAQLWIGSPESTTQACIAYLQQLFCAQNGCSHCSICKQIHDKQYYAAVWICPERQYTLEALEIIQERMAFALDAHEHCFFILEQADTLTTQCANSLLKSIEEPPRGYHFIFCAERQEALLPTITSRCLIKRIGSGQQAAPHQILFAYFTATRPQQPAPFLQEMQECTLTEHESLDLADRLLAYWMQQYKDAAHPEALAVACKRVELFKAALLMPPMPGSAKLFWKNLFLKYHLTF